MNPNQQWPRKYRSRSKSPCRNQKSHKPEQHAPQRHVRNGWQYSHYHGSEESEFMIHFYLKYVYFSTEIEIDSFIDYVRNRISRAALPQFIRIVQYNKKHKEVKLAIGNTINSGMKYDQDAVNILKGIKTIYLQNREQELKYTLPIISASFEPIYKSWNKEKSKKVSRSRSLKKTEEAKKLPDQEEIDESITCYIIGLPTNYNQHDVIAAIKELNQQKVFVDLPVSIELKQLIYLKVDRLKWSIFN